MLEYPVNGECEGKQAVKRLRREEENKYIQKNTAEILSSKEIKTEREFDEVMYQ